MPSAVFMQQALMDAYHSDYITLEDAMPIAEFIAPLYHIETDAISF